MQVVNRSKERPGVACTQWRKRYAHERTCKVALQGAKRRRGLLDPATRAALQLPREVVREVPIHRVSDKEREDPVLPVGRFAEWVGDVDVVWR